MFIYSYFNCFGAYIPYYLLCFSTLHFQNVSSSVFAAVNFLIVGQIKGIWI